MQMCRWYGSPEPGDLVFVERKTHRESWKGEESVKDRITLPKSKIVEFLDGTYTLDMAMKEGKVWAAALQLHSLSFTYQQNSM